MKLFPLMKGAADLVTDDFVRFRTSFSEIVQSHIPVAADIHFVSDINELSGIVFDRRQPSTLLKELGGLISGDLTHHVGTDYLLLPVYCYDGKTMMIHVCGLDETFIKHVAADWLLQLTREIRSHLLLLKQARTDETTGLLNLTNFEHLVKAINDDDKVRVVLIEITPVRVTREKIFNHTRRAVSSLSDFFHDRSALHHLGHSIFANIVPDYGHAKGDLESALVSYLKREGFRGVHVGSVGRTDLACDSGGAHDATSFPLLDKAWEALLYAASRGPYSYCDYRSLAAPKEHPLAAPSSVAEHELLALTRKLAAFSLVIFEKKQLVNRDYLDHLQANAVEDDEFTYFVLPTGDAKTARSFSGECARLCCRDIVEMAAGIAVYPFGACSRKGTIRNCKKALRHAQLLGTGDPVILDALSYNVAGDIFFAEGDMVAAVREYRQGLQLAPDDVNLNNSLGVTLALMDKVGQAMDCFSCALNVQPHNFMAIYNLGLAEISRSNRKHAFTLLEKAADMAETEGESVTFTDDLYLQVGRLAVELGEYEAAIDYLGRISPASSGSAHLSLGRAHYGLNDNGRAMVELQRALQRDRFDARAMGLLGKVYFEENQGAEIALSLCRNAIQIDPENNTLNLYYAEILAGCGLVEDAKSVTRKLVRRKNIREKAQFSMAKIYLIAGDYKNSLKWLEKIKQQPGKCRRSKLFQQQVRTEKKRIQNLQRQRA